LPAHYASDLRYAYTNDAPQVQIEVEGPNGVTQTTTFLIDSGAESSCLTRFFAEHLGVDTFIPADDVSMADGSTVEAYRAKGLVGHILDADGDRTGTKFDLEPFVIESGGFLLGRQDFFASFDVTFRHDENEPIVEISPRP
jgi:hypothetical protein